MGKTVLSQDQLADRIERVKPVSRYELANKAEVQAFVNRKVSVLAGITEMEIDEAKKQAAVDRKISEDMLHGILSEHLTRITFLQGRIAELELTRWQRFARWWNGFVEDVIWWFSSEPSDVEPETAAAIDNPYARLAESLCTESAEDLAENPVVADAVAELRRAGEYEEPSIANELPELQHLAEYSAEEMPLIGQPTEDGELTRGQDGPTCVADAYKAAGLCVERQCRECRVPFGRKHADGCVLGAILAIEAHEKTGAPLPDNVHRLSIPPAESLGDPEE